jgi:AraC family transcriptional regulator of adaptative response / DNA-3-methyladenine glycosylase II
MSRYAAVSTTGIYCRPGYSASPKPENVSGYGLAAAAEAAGFRACRRCRPYRTPEALVWIAAPELVCRAVQLILRGALDDGGESDLARRIGVSARHLRRLFQRHLGVTPDGLARSARVHFARRLLDDTDLTVEQIAFGAGFGSLRQFNRACREVFHESPTALRARRRKADRLLADGGLLLRLPYRPPLDWREMLHQLAEQATPGVESVGGGVYRRTIELEGDPGVLEIYDGEPGHALYLRAHLPHWEELMHLVARARQIVNLDLDLDAPLAAFRGDPTVARLVRERPGLRPAGTWDAVETGAHAIVAAGVTARTANRNLRQIVETYGVRVPGLEALGLTHLFPTASALADADFRGVRVSERTRRALRTFAARFASGDLLLDGSVPLDRLIGDLASIPGISESTAEYIAFRLGERDAFPAGAVALPAHAERWRPWRAVAATHLRVAAGAR